MTENIIWTIEGKIKHGQREEYEALMKEMVVEVKKEAGTTNYEWTIAPDGETVHVYERYKNAEAAKEHLGTWAKFQDRYMEVTEITRFTIFSHLTPELEEAVAGMNPIYMKPIGGFAK
ncbi:antibiotic biosynthesis monooxygenase [Halobacillus litoralis]|uniref:putative quinol monooxygenase n=1 Tax=Halobacillus litoralis TaxID=45668 RepID=UPI001CFDD5BC|nr:antibiotic biosynthesis monooxygenase [Halobacillus litoralis]WLR46614.1 antibiotic biosynthesis monooxygenase [Halobacillus litoralis]